MPLPPSPFYRGESDRLAVSGESIALTAAVSDTLPVDFATDTPALPKMLRQVVCLADGDIELQPPVGPSFTMPMTAGQVLDLYVAAVSAPDDTSFVGLV
jgi:hypothetical protein